MELCLLLLVVMAVGVASTGGTTTTSDTSGTSSSSGGGSGSGGGGGLFPSLQCGPASRRGRRLTGRPRPVQPPSTCQGPGGGRGAALCDQPGDDYPWEAIDNYLRQSSDFVKKRVENTLKASRIPALNSARRRKARSTDDVTKNTDDVTKDEVFASNASDKIRAKKHIDPPPVRQRVTVAKTTPARPTTFGPELDDFTELIYASDAQRQPEEAEVAPPTVRTTAAPPITTTQDPYTESACDYWDEIRSPFYAMNTHNEWKTLINMPNYETYIHMEHCMEERSQGRCAPGCRCTQRYTVRNMPVYDRDSNGCDVIYMDEFLFPSHCDCQCLPPGHALLRPGTEAPATTPVPEREGYPASPPEGWLPARPTAGRIGQTGEGKGEGEGGKEEGDEKVVIEVVEEKRDREGDLVLDEVKVEDREGGVEIVTITEVVEAEKSDDQAVPSIGSTENLKSTSLPPVTSAVTPGSGQHGGKDAEGETADRSTPTRPPPPAAILHHVTVRPRPRRPTAGPQLPPGVRWGASARRDPQEAPSSHRNRHRGPPEPRAEVTRR